MPNDPVVIDTPDTAVDTGVAEQSQDAASFPEQQPSMPRTMSKTDFADFIDPGDQEEGNIEEEIEPQDNQDVESELDQPTEDIPEEIEEDQQSLEPEPELNHAERRRAKLLEENQSFEQILEKRRQIEAQRQSIYEKDISSVLGQAYSNQQATVAPQAQPAIPPAKDPELSALEARMDQAATQYHSIQAQDPSDPRLAQLQQEWNAANNEKQAIEVFNRREAKRLATIKQQKYANLKTKQILASNRIGKFLKLNETGQTVLDPSSLVAQRAVQYATADGVAQNDPLFADYLIQATSELSAEGQIKANRQVKTEQRKAQQIANKAGIQSSGSVVGGGVPIGGHSLAALEKKAAAGDPVAREAFINASLSHYSKISGRR